MFQGLNVVAFIPARGGSKGLPGKNLMSLGGRSLIQRAIDSTQLEGDYLGFADMVVVSSDSPEILDAARNSGVDTVIPHERSAHAATDEATAADVLRDFFEQDDSFDDTRDLWVIYLQPTSPLRTAQHVQKAIDTLARTELARNLISITPLEKSPYWSLRIDEDGRITPVFPEALTQNRQSLKTAYVPNGAIYMFRYSDFAKAGAIPVDGAVPFIMSAEDSVDIDSQADFDRAAAILAKRAAEAPDEHSGEAQTQ